MPQIQSQFTWGLQSMSNKYIHGGFANRALLIMTEMPVFVHLYLFFSPLFSSVLEIRRLSPCYFWLSHFPVGNGVTSGKHFVGETLYTSLAKTKQPPVLQCLRNRQCALQQSRSCVGSALRRKALISSSSAYEGPRARAFRSPNNLFASLGQAPRSQL